MVIHYPPERLRHNSDRPTAITNVLVTTEGSSSTGEVPLGAPTCSARTRRGRWALYPSGEEVVVVWPGGVLTGRPAEVAAELNRLGGDRQDDLDRGAVWAIRQFLTDPAAAEGRPCVVDSGAELVHPKPRYWLSGPTNQSSHHPRPADLVRQHRPADPLARPQPAAGPSTSRLTAPRGQDPVPMSRS